jgi:transposase-like protein
MALSESALSELLVALTDRDRGVDVVRELAQWLAQELIEVQATQVIGAARYERSDGRVTERNGHRPRTLTTKAGDLHLAIPKLRKGSFFPSILEPRRRIDQALYSVVMEAYVSGVSTRSVDALVESMGSTAGVSKSEVSRICAGLDERVSAFRNPHSATPSSRTSTSTRSMSTSAMTPWARSCRGRSWWRPVSPARAAVRCSVSMSVTPKPRRSGPGSCAR